MNLLNLMADATTGSGLRIIYPVVRDGQFERWAAGSVLPPVEGPAVTELPRIPRGVAARAWAEPLLEDRHDPPLPREGNGTDQRGVVFPPLQGAAGRGPAPAWLCG